ncbi:MAG: hypothetical protein ACRBFS_12475 [Aureispira sp.]
MKAVTSIVFVLSLCQLLSAQTPTASTNSSLASTDAVDWANFEKELHKENWSFHTNKENKLLYIDFETLGGKMSRLVLKSAQEKVVVEDNHLFDLPVNTIYEVNLENLERGSYFVELYTYDHQVIKKEINIQ